MPSSTSLPEQPAPLPGASAPEAAASPLERMQAELKAVQQQALATQLSLKKLQARESVDPYTAIVAELPGLNSVNTALLGVASVLALGLVIVWWFLWHRPRARFLEAPYAAMPPVATRNTTTPAAQPSVAPPPNSQDWAPSTAAGEFSTHGFEPSSSFARQDPNMGFDSEAAATEVLRVRKSLAEKREARAQMLDREDGYDNEAGDASADPRLDLDLDLDEVHTPSAHAWLDNTFDDPPPQPVAATPETPADLELDLHLDPWHQPGESLPGAAAAQDADALHFSLALEDYGVQADNAPTPLAQPLHEPSMDPTPTAQVEQDKAAEPAPSAHLPGTKGYDFTITLALAQESAALELWSEARDLASEVLESDDPALVSEALSLLERLNQQELEAPPDTNWNTMR
ncbi:MAG: hypothetical protein V4627_08605 [Pseudomonadota bacterium]